jgi:hypothetical protein
MIKNRIICKEGEMEPETDILSPEFRAKLGEILSPENFRQLCWELEARKKLFIKEGKEELLLGSLDVEKDIFEIPVGSFCDHDCRFQSSTHYYNEDDDVGEEDCGLFDDSAPCDECKEKYPYGASIIIIAKEKPND